ncbi:MAG: hypothetical protein JWQ50_3673, partial [Caballeronia mineralivorans]|nr:hypothetical protein [Caballeronia mineralivorans]
MCWLSGTVAALSVAEDERFFGAV